MRTGSQAHPARYLNMNDLKEQQENSNSAKPPDRHP